VNKQNLAVQHDPAFADITNTGAIWMTHWGRSDGLTGQGVEDGI